MSYFGVRHGAMGHVPQGHGFGETMYATTILSVRKNGVVVSPCGLLAHLKTLIVVVVLLGRLLLVTVKSRKARK
jgi:hypothetical protein